MTQSDELIDAVIEQFGSLDSEGPIHFLEQEGYKQTNGIWQVSNDLSKMSRDEFVCLIFLVREWKHRFDLVATDYIREN